MKKPFIWIVMTFVAALILAACSSGAPTKGDVIVYVAGPLSGFQANTGQTVAGGVRLMAEQLNRSGGLLGYKVKVVALDDEADSDVAAGVAAQIKEAVIGAIAFSVSSATRIQARPPPRWTSTRIWRSSSSLRPHRKSHYHSRAIGTSSV
jgi:uncharacterized lipoprotein YmbA